MMSKSPVYPVIWHEDRVLLIDQTRLPAKYAIVEISRYEDMAEAIKIRAAAHSFEGKLFTIVSCSTISKKIISALKEDVPNAEELLTRKSSAFSGVIGPNGAVVGQPLIDDEGIVYAEIDLAKCIQPKQMHDILGHYNRFDIFDLRVNVAPTRKITFIDNHDDFHQGRNLNQ